MIGTRRLVALTVGVLGLVAAGITPGHASSSSGGPEDGQDTYNVPAKTLVTATNASSITFAANTSIGPVSVTCTTSVFSGKTGTTLRIATTPPTFTDGSGPCTDSAGGQDTVTSNTTNGKWSLTEKDLANDEGLPEPNATGDMMILAIPQAGIVDVASIGCTVTIAPTAAAKLVGTYNDAGTITFTKKSVPVALSGSSCPATASTAKVTVTYTLNPAIFDQG